MFAAGIVGIADATVAIAVVDAVLAPDLALANVNALFRGEIALALCVHKSCDQALWAISVADHAGDQPQRLTNRLLIVLARVVHRRKVTAGYEGDFVAIPVVIGGKQPPCVFVLLPVVIQRQPADCPGHPPAGSSSFESFAPGSDVRRAIVGSFVFADGAGRRYLDLIYTDDGDVGEKPAAQGRFGCAIG